MQNHILIANIGWSEDYRGGHVEGAMDYVVEHGSGGEAFAFQPGPGGLFYGYVRGGGLARWADIPWLVVFVSKPEGTTGLRLVGWYENARLSGYMTREEYRTDPGFQTVRLRDGSFERHLYNVVTRTAFLVPPADREGLQLPKRHPIGSTGVYYASGVTMPDTARQAAARTRIADWVLDTLPNWRHASRLPASGEIAAAALPGITIPDDGKPGGFSSVAESPDHAALKRWALAHPELVTGYSGRFASDTEVPLPSGDRVDVTYALAAERWMVEVKSWRSSDDDHRRGIYQCVKYRAVAAAMHRGTGLTIRAVLVTQRSLTSALDAERLALDIVHLVVPADRM